jgi:outer membrane protein assembly factor BamA
MKFFFLSQFDERESFDVILFNSTKGERWYRFVVSIPDFELRQGTDYSLAVDLILDYDKYLKNGFFGVGPDSRFDDREEYTREPFEATVVFSRGVARQTVLQAGARYRWIRNSNVTDSSTIPTSGSSLSSGIATAFSVTASARYDTRDSYINPSRGTVIRGEAELAPSVGSASFFRAGGTMQWYTPDVYPKTVFAFRLSGQMIDGPGLPIQFMLPLGGNQTLRGFPQDRFLGRVSLVGNVEFRFPLLWRFGAVAGLDAGKVWMNLSAIDLTGWRANTLFGIRFHMDTFIVRADLGLGPETTGFYLNFGQLF